MNTQTPSPPSSDETGHPEAIIAQAQAVLLEKFEAQLTDTLLRLCSSESALSGQLLESPDLEEAWQQLLPEYLADAVKEIADYPLVALGWAAYIGMALAQWWDADWTAQQAQGQFYERLRTPRGFDAMDEYIREDILGLTPDSEAYRRCEKLVQRCAQQTQTLIRREEIAPQSPLAFHCFVRSITVLARLGAALQLHRLGYKYEKQ